MSAAATKTDDRLAAKSNSKRAQTHRGRARGSNPRAHDRQLMLERRRRQKGVETLAKSIFQGLANQGYDQEHVMQLVNELLDLLSNEMASKSKAT